MKKLLLGAIALAFVVGMASSSFAAATATVGITVTVVETGPGIQNVGPAALALGTVQVDTDTFSGTTASRGIFRNIGSVQSDWDVTASAIAWTYLTDAPGTAIAVVDQCRLAGIFCQWDLNPVAIADFDSATDTLSLVSRPCTADDVARTADVVGVKGYDVPVSGVGDPERSIFFLFEAPIAGSGNMGVQQTITVTVNAVAG